MKKTVVLPEEEWSVVTCALGLAAHALNAEMREIVLSVRQLIDKQLLEQEPREDEVYALVRRLDRRDER